MNQDRPNADSLGGLYCTTERVFQKARTNTLPLIFFIHRQSTENDNRNLRRCIFSKPGSGHGLSLDGTGGEAVVTHDSIANADDISARALAVAFQRFSAKPIIKIRLSAVEKRQIVGRRQKRRSLKFRPLFRGRMRRHFSHGAFLLNNRRSFAVGGAGSSSNFMNAA